MVTMNDVYLSARYGRREEMATYANDLEELGFGVTCRWVLGDHEAPDATERQRARWAKEDIEDLTWARTLVTFTEGDGQTEGVVRGGRHVEMGMALVLRKRVMVVGPVENIFHCLPQVRRFPDWPTALTYLKRGSWE